MTRLQVVTLVLCMGTGASGTASSEIPLVTLGESRGEASWLISEWDAGQSARVRWVTQNVRPTADGGVELLLDAAPDDAARPYQGGEIQSTGSSATGTWGWLAQAPEMIDGAVFGMFLYQADWRNDPWLEFDFEFVGSDTTHVEINIHMEDAAGRHITLKNGPRVVDLGFDAAKRMHLYEIKVDEASASFSIDGEVVAILNANNMPGNVWYGGELISLVDLWAAAPAQEAWTGEWNYNGTPLVARIAKLSLPARQQASSRSIEPPPVGSKPDDMQ